MGLFTKGRLNPARLKLELITGGVSSGIETRTLLNASSGLSALVSRSESSPYEVSASGRHGCEIRLNGVTLLNVHQRELYPEPGVEDRLSELRVHIPRESCAVRREAACESCPFRDLVETGDSGPDPVRVSRLLKQKHRYLRIETCCPDAGAMKRIRAILRRCVSTKGPVGIFAGMPEEDSIELRLLRSAGADVMISPAWTRFAEGLALVCEKGGQSDSVTFKKYFEVTGIELDYTPNGGLPASRSLDDAFNTGLHPRLVAGASCGVSIDEAVELARRQARGYARGGWAIPKGFADWAVDALPPREVFSGLVENEKKPSGGKRPPPGVVYFL